MASDGEALTKQLISFTMRSGARFDSLTHSRTMKFMHISTVHRPLSTDMYTDPSQTTLGQNIK